jgi:hypothetical protein
MSAGWGSSGWGDPLVITSDALDGLLTGTASIWRRTGGTIDKYGIANPTLLMVEDNVPCKLSTKGAGTEFQVGKEIAIAEYKVFMRPRAYILSETHWIMSEARTFDILSAIAVKNRWSETHHLEVYVREVMPQTS